MQSLRASLLLRLAAAFSSLLLAVLNCSHSSTSRHQSRTQRGSPPALEENHSWLETLQSVLLFLLMHISYTVSDPGRCYVHSNLEDLCVLVFFSLWWQLQTGVVWAGFASASDIFSLSMIESEPLRAFDYRCVPQLYNGHRLFVLLKCASAQQLNAMLYCVFCFLLNVQSLKYCLIS